MCYLIVLFCFNSELRDLNFFDKNLKNQTKKRDIDGWNSHQWASKHIFIQSFNFIFINPFKNYYPPFKFFKKKKSRKCPQFQFKNQVKKRAKKDRRSINRAHINKKYKKSSINWNQSSWFQLIFCGRRCSMNISRFSSTVRNMMKHTNGASCSSSLHFAGRVPSNIMCSWMVIHDTWAHGMSSWSQPATAMQAPANPSLHAALAPILDDSQCGWLGIDIIDLGKSIIL